MSAKKKKKWIFGALSLLVGAVCALVLGAVFYGAMAYQLAGGETAAQTGAAQAEGTLTLGGAQLLSEQTLTERHGGQDCTVLRRRYQTEVGTQAEAITAQPAAYIERLSEEKWTPQLITGFVLAGMDAVYAVRGEEAMLCAREGDTVYALVSQADEQTLYALGAATGLE